MPPLLLTATLLVTVPAEFETIPVAGLVTIWPPAATAVAPAAFKGTVVWVWPIGCTTAPIDTVCCLVTAAVLGCAPTATTVPPPR